MKSMKKVASSQVIDTQKQEFLEIRPVPKFTPTKVFVNNDLPFNNPRKPEIISTIESH